MEINGILYNIVALNALGILGLGMAAAVIRIAGKEAKMFWERVCPAAFYIIGTSVAAGVVMWIGDHLFG